MKRAFILVTAVTAFPSTVWAQIPAAPPSPKAPPAGAAPAPTSGPTPPTPNAAPPTAGSHAAAPPDAGAPPGDQYYVDQAPQPTAPEQAGSPEPPPFEPPPPPPPVLFEEPPPPPRIHHVAPLSSLSLGARLGWFFPFGNLWARALPLSGGDYVLDGVRWRDYASSGPMFELNAGMRFGRAYTVFALWERAELGSGRGRTAPNDGPQDGAESDFWAVGLRATTNPDRLGFVTEIAVGYRRARTFFKNDVEYQFTDAPFEARLGLGAELRVSRMTTFSALATVGVGGFGSAERVAPNGKAWSLLSSSDQSDGHGWATLTVGAHFDLLPSRY